MNLSTLLESGLEFFGLYYGTYRARVIRNDDPLNLGRIMVHCPQVHGPNYPQTWAWPVTAYSVCKGGIWAIPDVGEWVHVQFDHGRAEYPLWLGGWWSEKETTTDMTPSKVVVCTPEGLKVVMDRKEMTILVEQSQGNSVMISDAECRVTHNLKVKVDAMDVDIVSQGRCRVTSMDEVQVTAMDDVNILATGTVTVDGSDSVEIGSAGSIKVGAAEQISIESDTEVEVKSTTKVTVVAPTGEMTLDELTITGKTTFNGDIKVNGNGDVDGDWTATNNSPHHEHPVVNDPIKGMIAKRGI